MRKQLTTHRCVFVGRKTQIITSDEIALIRSIIMWLVKKDHYNVMKRKAFNLCILSMERIPNNIVVHNRRKNIHKTHIVAIIRNTILHCYVRCEWLINPLKFTMLLTDPRIKHSNWNFRNAKKKWNYFVSRFTCPFIQTQNQFFYNISQCRRKFF